MKRQLLAGLCLAARAALAGNSSPGLAADPTALTELVNAASLDVMSEATLKACGDVGVAAFAQMREAWVAWRDKHQLAPLRSVVMDLMRRRGSSGPGWDTITEPLRQRVLTDPKPEAACAALARDWQGAGMDASALYPRARATALAVVQAKLASAPTLPTVEAASARGQVLLPSQIPALSRQRGHWLVVSTDEAQRKLGPVYVKGRVERWSHRDDRYRLVQEQGERQVPAYVSLNVDVEPWVGREVVLRGLVTSLSEGSMTLDEASLVVDPSGLVPSTLPAQPLERKEVLLQRVLSTPGQGLAEKDLAAVVIHGESNFNNGTHWQEDVRFLLRDGTAYRRTEMPPNQLNVVASRQLEPQRWARWRAVGKSPVGPQGWPAAGPPPEGGKGTGGGPACPCEMQDQDDDGRPSGEWQVVKHHAVRPWPADTRLEGSYSRGSFSGSLVLGGTSSTRSIRFTRDGRFERSYSSFSGSGSLAATLNNTNIAASSHGDGKGSSSTGGGTVGGPFGTVGAVSSRKHDDGASRRGRYQLSGWVLTLDYDDGHQERLLSFPVYDDNKTVYVGNGSLGLDK